MFQFMGGEMVLATAGEAKRPRHDLPTAARYMYLLPVAFYLVAILLVGVNVNYLDPRIYHSHISWFLQSRLEGIQTGARSPFVIAVHNAGIRGLPGFLNGCLLFSALTAAWVLYSLHQSAWLTHGIRNSALYVSSRTLFVLAQRSEFNTVRRTLGKTNNGHTPLAAIFTSFVLGLLAFLAVRAKDAVFQEVCKTVPILQRSYSSACSLYTFSVVCTPDQCSVFMVASASHSLDSSGGKGKLYAVVCALLTVTQNGFLSQGHEPRRDTLQAKPL